MCKRGSQNICCVRNAFRGRLDIWSVMVTVVWTELLSRAFHNPSQGLIIVNPWRSDSHDCWWGPEPLSKMASHDGLWEPGPLSEPHIMADWVLAPLVRWPHIMADVTLSPNVNWPHMMTDVTLPHSVKWPHLKHVETRAPWRDGLSQWLTSLRPPSERWLYMLTWDPAPLVEMVSRDGCWGPSSIGELPHRMADETVALLLGSQGGNGLVGVSGQWQYLYVCLERNAYSVKGKGQWNIMYHSTISDGGTQQSKKYSTKLNFVQLVNEDQQQRLFDLFVLWFPGISDLHWSSTISILTALYSQVIKN